MLCLRDYGLFFLISTARQQLLGKVMNAICQTRLAVLPLFLVYIRFAKVYPLDIDLDGVLFYTTLAIYQLPSQGTQRCRHGRTVERSNAKKQTKLEGNKEFSIRNIVQFKQNFSLDCLDTQILLARVFRLHGSSAASIPLNLPNYLPNASTPTSHNSTSPAILMKSPLALQNGPLIGPRTLHARLPRQPAQVHYPKLSSQSRPQSTTARIRSSEDGRGSDPGR